MTTSRIRAKWCQGLFCIHPKLSIMYVTIPCQASLYHVFSLPTYSRGLWRWEVTGHFPNVPSSWLAASFHTPLTDQTVIPTSLPLLQEALETSSVLWSLLWPQDTPPPYQLWSHSTLSFDCLLVFFLGSREEVPCLSFLSSSRESGTCRWSVCVSRENKVTVKNHFIFVILVRSVGQLAWLKLREI